MPMTEQQKFAIQNPCFTEEKSKDPAFVRFVEKDDRLDSIIGITVDIPLKSQTSSLKRFFEGGVWHCYVSYFDQDDNHIPTSNWTDLRARAESQLEEALSGVGFKSSFIFTYEDNALHYRVPLKPEEEKEALSYVKKNIVSRTSRLRGKFGAGNSDNNERADNSELQES